MTLTWTVAHTSMCDAHHCAVAVGQRKLFGRQQHFATRGDRRQWPGRALYSQELRKHRETLQVMCDRLHHGCAKLQREFREQEQAFKTMLETRNYDDYDGLRLLFPCKLAERMNKSKENIEHLKAQLLQQQGRVDHCQAELRAWTKQKCGALRGRKNTLLSKHPGSKNRLRNGMPRGNLLHLALQAKKHSRFGLRGVVHSIYFKQDLLNIWIMTKVHRTATTQAPA